MSGRLRRGRGLGSGTSLLNRSCAESDLGDEKQNTQIQMSEISNAKDVLTVFINII